MDFGRIVALDNSRNLKDSVGSDVISLQLDGGRERFFELLKGLEWVKKISEHDGIIDINVRQSETRIPELVNLAQRAGTRIRSVSLREPTLEDVFLQYTGRSIRDEDGGNRALMRERVRSMRRKS